MDTFANAFIFVLEYESKSGMSTGAVSVDYKACRLLTCRD